MCPASTTVDSHSESEPAVSVFAVADEFNFDQTLAFEDRIDEPVVLCNPNAVAETDSGSLPLQLFAASRKGIGAKTGDFLKNPRADAFREPGYVFFDRAAVFNVPAHG